jgi:phage-related minor tail protein
LLVQPVGGRNLAGAGEVNDEAIGHVGRGQTGVLGARAVDVHIEGGQSRRLLDARIGDTGNVTDLRQ